MFKLKFTLRAEGKYNLNPEQNDIATAIPDSESGMFVVMGFGS